MYTFQPFTCVSSPKSLLIDEELSVKMAQCPIFEAKPHCLEERNVNLRPGQFLAFPEYSAASPLHLVSRVLLILIVGEDASRPERKRTHAPLETNIKITVILRMPTQLSLIMLPWRPQHP